MSHPAIEYRLATLSDVATIFQLAERAWQATYPSIITQEQINYMLHWMYGAEVITAQLTEGSISWLLLVSSDAGFPGNYFQTPAGESLLGFASFGPHAADVGVQRLHKLYLDPSLKGLGLGQLLLQEVVRRLPASTSALELNVNKRNPATGFYLRLGFEVYREEVLEIGEGFIMDDYVMRLGR